jgi:hypothetical protein
MDEEGSKQVKMVGLIDKRQITTLLACTKSGKLLPPQLIYDHYRLLFFYLIFGRLAWMNSNFQNKMSVLCSK